MKNVFHCKTLDCIGFCIAEELNFFDCIYISFLLLFSYLLILILISILKYLNKGPVCSQVNCLRCNIIHMGKTCKEYQDDLKINAINDKNAKKNQEALEVGIY